MQRISLCRLADGILPVRVLSADAVLQCGRMSHDPSSRRLLVEITLVKAEAGRVSGRSVWTVRARLETSAYDVRSSAWGSCQFGRSILRTVINSQLKYFA